MSSYYLNALLSKYTAAGCFFPNAERSSYRGGTQRGGLWLCLAGASAASSCGFYDINNAVYYSPPLFIYSFFTLGYGFIHPTAHRNLTDRSRLTSSSRDSNLATGQANPHLAI